MAVRTIGAGKEEKREEEDAAEQHIRDIAYIFCRLFKKKSLIKTLLLQFKRFPLEQRTLIFDAVELTHLFVSVQVALGHFFGCIYPAGVRQYTAD